jgi:hypothetical protein
MTLYIKLWWFKFRLCVLSYSINDDSRNYFAFAIAFGKSMYGVAWRKSGVACANGGPSEFVRIYGGPSEFVRIYI